VSFLRVARKCRARKCHVTEICSLFLTSIMIELHDLSSSESDEGTSDNSCLPSVVCTSTSECSSNSIKYNATNIKQFLKEQPTKYVVVDNHKISHTKPSPCWIRFGLPAIKDENDRNIIIKNFALCRSCYATYKYTYQRNH
jgi:hypothetical protein